MYLALRSIEMYINHKTNQSTNILKYFLYINSVLDMMGKMKKFERESSYILILKKPNIDLEDADKNKQTNKTDIQHDLSD